MEYLISQTKSKGELLSPAHFVYHSNDWLWREAIIS